MFRKSLWYSAVLLISVSAQWTTIISPPESAVTGVSNKSALNDDVVASIDLNATAPSFEQLVREGLYRMRIDNPFTELRLVSVGPTNDAPSASRIRDFKYVALLGRDTRSQEWLRIDNKRGRNEWNVVTQPVTVPPEFAALPGFTFAAYPISFEVAFSLARPDGPRMRSFAEIRLCREGYPGAMGQGLAYYFRDANLRRLIFVDVQDGHVQHVDLPSSDIVDETLDDRLWDLHTSTTPNETWTS